MVVKVADAPRNKRQLEPLLTLDQVAELLSTSPRHIRELVFRRTIPSVRVGRLVRFDPLEIEAWLEASRPPEPDLVA